MRTMYMTYIEVLEPNYGKYCHDMTHELTGNFACLEICGEFGSIGVGPDDEPFGANQPFMADSGYDLTRRSGLRIVILRDEP